MLLGVMLCLAHKIQDRLAALAHALRMTDPPVSG
jgi:hypothetical protein